MMLLKKIGPFVVLLVVVQSGCQSFRPNTTAGGLLGGTTGGMIGAAIGSSEGKSGEGALIGALAGGLTGAAIGNQADQVNDRQRQIENQNAARVRESAVSIGDVIQMSQTGLGDELIINQINSNGIVRRATTNDLIQLKNAGVSDSVITKFQTAPNAAAYPAAIPPQPNYVTTGPPFYWEQDCVPVYPAPPIIHRPVPLRYPHRHGVRPRAGFAVHF